MRDDQSSFRSDTVFFLYPIRCLTRCQHPMECKTAVIIRLLYLCSLSRTKSAHATKAQWLFHLNIYSPDNLKSILCSVNQMKSFTVFSQAKDTNFRYKLEPKSIWPWKEREKMPYKSRSPEYVSQLTAPILLKS